MGVERPERPAGRPAGVVAYLRVSTDEQRERATIETQRVEVERYATTHDIALTAWYADDGWSGRKLTLAHRPEGAALLTDAGPRSVQTVIVYRVDRLGRGRKLLATLDELETAGVRYIVSVTEATYDLRNANDEFHLTMLSGVSGYEASSFLRRSKDATNRLAREGAWLGGIVPYGYHVEGEKRGARLVASTEPQPGCGLSEVDVVRLLYRRLVEDNWPCQRIADELNALGVPPSYARDGRAVLRGKRAQATQGIWRAGRVRNMLVSETYKGVHHYGKRSADEEREVIERAVPAIVDADTWARAQATLRAHNQFNPRSVTHEYLLRGLIKCSLCGLTYMGTQWSDGRGATKSYYRCNGASQPRGIYGATGHKCPSKAVHGPKLEAAVWADCEDFIRDPGPILEQLAAQMHGEGARADTIRDEAATFRLRLGAKQAERDTVVGLYRRGRIDAATLDRQLDDIGAEERELQESIADCEAQLADARLAEEDLRSADTLLRDLRERLGESPDFETRCTIVRTLVSGIVVETRIDEQGHKTARAIVTYRFDAPERRHLLPAVTTRRGRDSSPPPA